MIYLLGWWVLFFCLSIQIVSRYQGRFFVFLILLFFAGISFFRGDVGTDTHNYELMLQGFSDDYIWSGQEIGFVGLGLGLVSFAPSVEFAVRAISLVLFGFLGLFVFRSDRNERFMLLAYILPAFAYQYSMNGLRIGLASGLLMLVVQMFRRKGGVSALKMAPLPLLFHYSSAFSLIFIAASQRSWAQFSNVLLLFALILFGGAIFLFSESYFLYKVEAYQQMESPSSLSGLSKIIPLFFMLAGLVWGNLYRPKKIKLLTLSVFSILAAWLLAQYSYSGLRILDLLSFAIPLSILATYSRAGLAFDPPIQAGMFGAGIVSALGVWRGFVLGYGDGNSPFLPYHTLSFGLF